MTGKHADLCVTFANEKALETAGSLGYESIGLACEFRNSESFRKFAKEALPTSAAGINILTCAIITENVAENAKKALEISDIVIAEPKSEEACRQASESYEVDAIMSPEKYVENDMTDYKSSGLDHVMMKYMAERNIAYAIRFSDILRSYGAKRIQLLGRIRQNITLAEKYKTPVIAVSGAANEYEMRAPREIASYLSFLGLRENAGKAVCENPSAVIKKAQDRKSPEVITEGVSVKSWGKQQNTPKRRHGWY